MQPGMQQGMQPGMQQGMQPVMQQGMVQMQPAQYAQPVAAKATPGGASEDTKEQLDEVRSRMGLRISGQSTAEHRVAKIVAAINPSLLALKPIPSLFVGLIVLGAGVVFVFAYTGAQMKQCTVGTTLGAFASSATSYREDIDSYFTKVGKYPFGSWEIRKSQTSRDTEFKACRLPHYSCFEYEDNCRQRQASCPCHGERKTEAFGKCSMLQFDPVQNHMCAAAECGSVPVMAYYLECPTFTTAFGAALGVWAVFQTVLVVLMVFISKFCCGAAKPKKGL